MTPSTDIEQYRAGFEAWAVTYGYSIEKIGGEYQDDDTIYAWHGYSAAKLESDPYAAYVKQCQENGVLHCSRESWESITSRPANWRERAAQACEKEAVDTNGDYRNACAECAAAIRNLDPGNPGELAQGDALDAARYRFMRSEASGNFIRFVPYGKPIEIDEAIDRAIATSTSKREG